MWPHNERKKDLFKTDRMPILCLVSSLATKEWTTMFEKPKIRECHSCMKESPGAKLLPCTCTLLVPSFSYSASIPPEIFSILWFITTCYIDITCVLLASISLEWGQTLQERLNTKTPPLLNRAFKMANRKSAFLEFVWPHFLNKLASNWYLKLRVSAHSWLR